MEYIFGNFAESRHYKGENSSGFVTLFHDGIIHSVTALQPEYDKSLSEEENLTREGTDLAFNFRDGKEHHLCFRPGSIVLPYQAQYGIMVSEDGRFFFTNDWRTGLFCRSVETGELIWQLKKPHACCTTVYGQTVVCHFEGNSIQWIDLISGEVKKRHPYTVSPKFVLLSRDYFLTGPVRGFYSVWEGENIVAKIPCDILTPPGHNWIMLDGTIKENQIFIRGWKDHCKTTFEIDIRQWRV